MPSIPPPEFNWVLGVLSELCEWIYLKVEALTQFILEQLEDGEDFLDVLNPWTKIETLAIRDCNMWNLKRGEILQLERKGYYKCDVPFTRPSKPVVLFAIPDDRQ
ncbi:hypothetical protein Pint_27054 [Pistacia integerrima]|uniref:Uncharacterized protein n=1 Tax=Pistacia integerrima TaxID=434235 RepID=A0ACC0YP57_9ROSI|nr:hypothetical protein Pint_27054 [Pistacia integerrima]